LLYDSSCENVACKIPTSPVWLDFIGKMLHVQIHFMKRMNMISHNGIALDYEKKMWDYLDGVSVMYKRKNGLE